MHLVDHLFIFLLFVVQPIHGAISFRRYIARIEAGDEADRARLYKDVLVLEWVSLAVLATAWYLLGRPATDLGFVPAGGTGFWVGVAILAAVTVFLIVSWRMSVTMSPENKQKQKESIGKLVHFLPQSDRDLRQFIAVSVTAGIVEEIVYRGFVFWYLAPLMPIWAVVIVSSVAFGLGHSYQGVGGMIRVTIIGLAFGAFYVLTGSIWLPILAHVILDALQGFSLVEILRPVEHSEPKPATQ